MRDQYNREVCYMRISVTDRCDLGCVYCRGQVKEERQGGQDLLSFDEIVEICQEAAALGVSRFKITGGEPLLRPGCENLIRQIKKIRGVCQVTLTTNGTKLAGKLEELMAAGLDAVNVSLDTVSQGLYKEITGRDVAERVQEGIVLAVQKGLPVKVNSVLQDTVGQAERQALVETMGKIGVPVRFIEQMPIGTGKSGVSKETVREEFCAKYPGMRLAGSVYGNGPAVYYWIPELGTSVGFISAVTDCFCVSCNRIRLTSDGRLKPCLCYKDSLDIKPYVRNHSLPDVERRQLLKETLKEAVRRKPAGHCFNRVDEASKSSVEDRQMIEIGG